MGEPTVAYEAVIIKTSDVTAKVLFWGGKKCNDSSFPNSRVNVPVCVGGFQIPWKLESASGIPLVITSAIYMYSPQSCPEKDDNLATQNKQDVQI